MMGHLQLSHLSRLLYVISSIRTRKRNIRLTPEYA